MDEWLSLDMVRRAVDELQDVLGCSYWVGLESPAGQDYLLKRLTQATES